MENDPDRPLRGDEEPAGVADELHGAAVIALDECRRDPNSISAKRVLGQVFERELDELHTPEGSSYFSAHPEETQAQEEERKRDERLLMGAVTATASRMLREQGIRVRKCQRDVEAERGGGGAYVLEAYDREGRSFIVKWGTELAESLASGAGGTTNLVERIGQAVGRKILAERDNYFRRAGLL
jgi:hypothetical protein